jgi:hypothetical protein
MRSLWTPAELRILGRLKTPALIQRFLDEEISYNKEIGGATCRSPRRVLRDRTAQCMEGALFAAAALRLLGHPPLLLDLEATRDSDHVLAIYKRNGAWGALAKSNFSGLRSREPVYRTLRELAISYFEHYFNLRRQKTLRGFSRPVNLRRFDARDWERSEDFVWFVPEHLCEIPHTPLLTPRQERALSLVDRRLFNAGKLGAAGL